MLDIRYFVHGTTYDNQNHIAAGWNHSDLTALGISQIVEASKRLKDEHFDLIISSDQQRTRETAQLLFKDRDIKIFYDSRLRECNYGDLNGKSNDQVNYLNHIDVSFPNGESLMDVEKRVRDLLSFLKINYPNCKIAFVSHRSPQLALEVITKYKTWIQAIEEDWRKEGKWILGWKYQYE